MASNSLSQSEDGTKTVSAIAAVRAPAQPNLLFATGVIRNGICYYDEPITFPAPVLRLITNGPESLPPIQPENTRTLQWNWLRRCRKAFLCNAMDGCDRRLHVVGCGRP